MILIIAIETKFVIKDVNDTKHHIKDLIDCELMSRSREPSATYSLSIRQASVFRLKRFSSLLHY